MKLLITTLVVGFISTAAHGKDLQTANEMLYKEIQSMDNQLFDIESMQYRALERDC